MAKFVHLCKKIFGDYRESEFDVWANAEQIRSISKKGGIVRCSFIGIPDTIYVIDSWCAEEIGDLLSNLVERPEPVRPDNSNGIGATDF